MLVHAPFNGITSTIIAAAIEVHRHLGPGLLESSYLMCLLRELADRGVQFESQVAVPIVYKGVKLSPAYRVDLLVENLIVVEVKSMERLLPVREAQTLTYLRLLNSPAGLLINFNVPKLVDGLTRVINNRYVGPDPEDSAQTHTG
jgi:GxxExxY protein